MPNKTETVQPDSSDGDYPEINWGSPNLSGAEKELIKHLEPLQPEYQQIINKAYLLGEKVLTPRRRPEPTGSDKAHWDDPKERIPQQPPAPLKLAAIIRFGCQHSFQLDRNNFVFDCWAAAFMKGYHYNTENTEVELDGVIVVLDKLYTNSWIAYRKVFGLGITPKTDFISMVLCHLRDKQISPWADKMKSLVPLSPEQFEAKHGFDPHHMAEFITGDCGELVQRLWLLHFTGSMLRTFHPGSQYDHMLILVSPEKGLRKTTLIQTIAKLPEDPKHSTKHYVQLRTLKSEKSIQERVKGRKIVNLDECDSAFRGLQADDLKEAVTLRVDNYRASYASTAQDHPRICTIFGTTNTMGLIQDLKGDRRFFPILVSKTIDIDWMTDNWEDFWGFYLWAYKQMEAGNTEYRSHLTKAEEAMLTKLQSRFKATTVWMETLEAILDILEDKYPCLAIKASDLLMVIGKETGTTKNHMAEDTKDKMMTERGYLEGRPKLADGSQPGKPVLYRGESKTARPKLVCRNEIEGAYIHLKDGTYQPRPTVLAPLDITEVAPTPMVINPLKTTDPLANSATQLDIFGVLQQITRQQELAAMDRAFEANKDPNEYVAPF